MSIEEIRDARVRRAQAFRDREAEYAAAVEAFVVQLADLHYTRMRSVAALSFATDDAMREASRVWARTLIDRTLAADPDPIAPAGP